MLKRARTLIGKHLVLSVTLALVGVFSLAVPTIARHYYLANSLDRDKRLRQIDALNSEPSSEAIPALLAAAVDKDADVSEHAMRLLIQHYRAEAEPYLKKELVAGRGRAFNTALLIVSIGKYQNLQEVVRELAVSPAHDQFEQLSATFTLRELDDTEGLRTVAATHPDKRLRDFATAMSHSIR